MFRSNELQNLRHKQFSGKSLHFFSAIYVILLPANKFYFEVPMLKDKIFLSASLT